MSITPNPAADFSPIINGYSGIQPFRFWCQKVLPLVYDDSLSYYELLNKVVDYLNHTIEDVATAEGNIDALATAYNQLQNYVNTYFDTLDVQVEINNKLNAMAISGELDELLSPIVAEQIGGVVEDQIDAVVADQIDEVVADQIDDVVGEQLPSQVATQSPSVITSWLNEHVTPVGSAVIVDDSLSITGAAADAKVVGSDIYNGKDRTSNYQYGMTYFRPTDAGYSSDNKMSTANIPVNSLCYASGAQLQHGTDETFPTDLNNSKYYWIFCWSNTRYSTTHGSGRGYILIASDFSKYYFGHSGNSGATTTWYDLVTPIDETLSVEGAAAESSTVGGALYLNKNRSHNWASGFTWWSPFSAGWSTESNPKLTPLDIPPNTICQLNGGIMNNTAFPDDISYIETSYYLTLCLKNLQTTNDIRYYILIPTRSNKIYHGIKSASDNYVTWSKDYIEIDDTLSVSGKAADAKAVGDYIYKNNIAAPLKLRTVSQTSSGFTWTYNDGVYNVIGENPVPSGGIAYNLINKQVLPNQIRAGGELYIEYETSDPNVYIRVMTYDSNDNATYLRPITKSTVVKIPSNTVQILVRLAASEGTDLSNGATINKVNIYKSENINNIASQNIKILFLGNSYTHDCAEYFPFIFNEIAPECQITCGIAFHGGATLNQYMDWFDDGTAALDYAKYKTTDTSWDIVAAVGSTHTEDNVTVKYVLRDEPWDIVVIQQASSSQGNWSTFSNINLIIDKYAEYIRTQHNKSCRIGYLMPQLRFRPNTEPNYLVTYEDQQECIQKILETTPVDFIIPCGTAIENARGNTTLNAIGNGAGGNTGHLVCDNNGHLQQGLAELIPAYVVVLKVFDLLGKPYGIMGDPIRPTQDVVDAWDVPGKYDSYPASDTSQGVSDANCLLAQRCAIAAIKNPYEITQI